MSVGTAREQARASSLPTPRQYLWNMAGLGLPLLSAFISIPVLIQNLGMQRFGILSLLMAAFTYVSLLDLGLSSAVVYRISSMRAQGESHMAIWRLTYTASISVLMLGVALGLVLFHAAPWIAQLPDINARPWAQEAVSGLRLLALVIPFVFVGALLAGVLSGYGKFGQVNAVRSVSGVFSTLGPAVASLWCQDLVIACGIVAAARAGGALVHFLQCQRLMPRPEGLENWSLSRAALTSLLPFGAWLTVSNLVGPFMVYMDRFYLAAVRPIEEVGHYVAPYELITKLALLPAGVLPVLFPLMVARWVRPDVAIERLSARLPAMIGIGCAVPAAAVAVLAPEIMGSWTSGRVPPASATVLQALAGGVLVNCVAQVFLLQVHSSGRTAAVARLHLGELAFYAALLWFLTERWGIIGVALAWSIRVALDCVLLCRMATTSLAPEHQRQCWQALCATLSFGSLLAMLSCVPSLMLRGACVLLAGAVVLWMSRGMLRAILLEQRRIGAVSSTGV